jgi:Glycosyltransferase Family 4
MQARAVLGNARAVSGVWRLARLCGRQRIDVIHVTDRPRDVMVGWVVARLGGCRLLVHAHTNYGKPATARFAARIADWILRQTDGLVAVSRFTANSYLLGAGLREDRVFAVHNSVDASLFSPEVESASRTAMRERLGIPLGVPVVASLARLTRWKGQLQLLEAFARLRQRFPQLHNPGNRSDGAPDFLLCSDVLRRLFPYAISEKEARRGSRRSPCTFAVELQAVNFVSTIGQDYLPGQSYLLGRGWHKGAPDGGTSSMDRLAPGSPEHVLPGHAGPTHLAQMVQTVIYSVALGKTLRAHAEHTIDWVVRVRREGGSWDSRVGPSAGELGAEPETRRQPPVAPSRGPRSPETSKT